jgi:hypothetical protein
MKRLSVYGGSFKMYMTAELLHLLVWCQETFFSAWTAKILFRLRIRSFPWENVNS